MGKKNKNNNPSLGRALIKDRFGNNNGRKFVSDNSMLHTTEIQDGYDWGRLNLQSVTEESSFQEFLSTAELAGTEFQAEKLNIKFINPSNNIGLLTKQEIIDVEKIQDKHRHLIRIPRRPSWNITTTPEQLNQNEKEYFLEWRRSLAQLQEEEGVLLTPYEKNLEFWRQLWRVVERSDVIVQIVDARNPLLFHCEDLEKYVKETSAYKMNMILLNKADFLTEKQRQHWVDYFNLVQLRVVFFSALDGNEDAIQSPKLPEPTSTVTSSDTDGDNASDVATLKEEIKVLESALEETATRLDEINKKLTKVVSLNDSLIVNTTQIYSRLELIELFRTLHNDIKVTENLTTIGLVGYPNVGKSSTINALLSAKKVSVSATPGKTKHFQTLFLDKDILLCDCPGLVMPSFVYTKAEMVLNGILPIDQLRDHVPPINLVTHLIPRHILEEKYGLMLPPPLEYEDASRGPTSEELLNAYGYMRGFMTANGQPDNPRAARYILKDFVNGKLLYCHTPPGIDQSQYHTWPDKQLTSTDKVLPPRYLRATKNSRDLTSVELQKMFFQQTSSGVHAKGVQGKIMGVPTGTQKINTLDVQGSDKPWKIINKHENKKKKEKLRRVYAHLDQH